MAQLEVIKLKIVINYDLLEKIKESKTGFSLKRSTSKILLYTSFASMIYTSIAKTDNIETIQTLSQISCFFTLYVASESIGSILQSKVYKSKAINKLKQLSQALKDINVSTDYELLQKSYVYKKSYKIKFNDYLLPYIKQDKYIMVPTCDCYGEKETSLLQEHVIGSSKYFLSHGTPKKLVKFAYNPT